jgi:N-acetylmuramoyl-L-alanine amidase
MNSNKIMSKLFAITIIVVLGYIAYISTRPPIPVIIQAGHEGRTSGNTGAENGDEKESEWNTIVADEVARKLKSWGIESLRVPADTKFLKANIAVAIHFDSAKRICHSGASIGYPDTNSLSLANRWKSIYNSYFPFGWHQDNFTPNLKHYYAYHWIKANQFVVLELGELTCDKQLRWLKPRRKKIAALIAYTIATELGYDVKKPKL